MYLRAQIACKWKWDTAGARFLVFSVHLEFNTDNKEKENKRHSLPPALHK